MKKTILILTVASLVSIPLLSRPGEEVHYNSSVELYKQAEEEFQKGHYRKSLQLLREALEKNSSYSKAHLLSGEASNEIGDYERALVHFDQVLNADPHNLDARIGKGRAMTGLGRLDQAEEMFQQVRKKDPGNTHNLFGLARLRIMAGRFDLARKYLQLILRKDPAYRDALQQMAILETRLGNIESGLEYLKRAEAVDPGHNSIAITRGIVISLRADAAPSEEERLALKDEAADAFRTAARENPGQALLERIIRLDIERGVPEQALQVLEQAREIYSSHSLLRLSSNVSQALYSKTGERKHLDAAMNDLAELCQKDPGDPLACYRLEMLSLSHPGTSQLRAMLANRHLQIADLYEKELRYGLLISHLREALQLSPGRPEIEKRLLDFYRSRGDFQSYLKSLTTLRDQNPDEPLWQYRLERALQSRENYLAYREGLNELQAAGYSTRRPAVVLVLDFSSDSGMHWNEEEVVARALEDALNDVGKIRAADESVRDRLRELRNAEVAIDNPDYGERVRSDYRPLLFDAADYEFLDELDRNAGARDRIRYILSGSFTASSGEIHVKYSLRDRFTGNVIHSGTAHASGEDALHRAALRITREVSARAPVRGEIVKISQDRVFIHAGRADGLKKGQIFMLDGNPERTFEVVELDTSFAALIPAKSGNLLSTGMVLISNPRMR